MLKVTQLLLLRGDMNVSAIDVYPMKSLRGSPLETALVSSHGLDTIAARCWWIPRRA